MAEKELARERQDLEEEEKRRIAAAMEEFGKELETETVQDKMKAEKSLNNLAQRKEKLLKVSSHSFVDDVEVGDSLNFFVMHCCSNHPGQEG